MRPKSRFTLRTPTCWYVGTDYHGPLFNKTVDNCLHDHYLGKLQKLYTVYRPSQSKQNLALKQIRCIPIQFITQESRTQVEDKGKKHTIKSKKEQKF